MFVKMNEPMNEPMNEEEDNEEEPICKTTKILVVPAPSVTKKEETAKPPRKKMIVQNENWTTTAETYSTQEAQLGLLYDLQSDNRPLNVCGNILLSHLKTKQSGYRSQDTIKGLYDETRFVRVEDIVRLLIDSGLSCFYCKKWATLFYENVRDPRQWSLERISNDDGHNRGNLVIACLDCNMRRRTMYQDRYIATKQLRVNKLM